MKVRACTLINQGRERRGGRGGADEVGGEETRRIRGV